MSSESENSKSHNKSDTNSLTFESSSESGESVKVKTSKKTSPISPKKKPNLKAKT